MGLRLKLEVFEFFPYGMLEIVFGSFTGAIEMAQWFQVEDAIDICSLSQFFDRMAEDVKLRLKTSSPRHSLLTRIDPINHESINPISIHLIFSIFLYFLQISKSRFCHQMKRGQLWKR